MVKVNMSQKDGKTFKVELENFDNLIGKSIGDKISGTEVSPDLTGYELEIKGTSDKSGFPGMKGEIGSGLSRKLLKRGFAMHNTEKGLRVRKSIRGELISDKTAQINTNIITSGTKKIEEVFPDQCQPKKKEGEESKPTEAEAKPEVPKEEVKPEEKKEESANKPEGGERSRESPVAPDSQRGREEGGHKPVEEKKE